jgi:pantoate--beta-alanine ligase
LFDDPARSSYLSAIGAERRLPPGASNTGSSARRRRHFTMPHQPFVARTLEGLDRATARFRAQVGQIALIPTMGALHAGHLALVRLAQTKARRVVVSIFVNPAQFAPHEDFASYPRTVATDLAALRTLGVDLVWAPPPDLMYPPGFATRVTPDGPATAGLEDKFRPHFFGGVATVVTKLFTQVRPHFAVFGEKDYQQLKVVTRMAADLDLRVKVIGAPTTREPDGLALSSRNVYLSADERARAPSLHRVLKQCAARIADGKPIAAVTADGAAELERTGFVVDYLAARHAETLAPIDALANGPIRLLVAARIGKTRLIDNIGV